MFGTFQNIDFFGLFKYGGRVGKRLLANCSILLVQNSLHYLNIMTFESFLLFFFFSRPVCFKVLKIKLILLNFKHGVQRSHSQA